MLPSAEHRLLNQQSPTYQRLKSRAARKAERLTGENVVMDCGWGRLLMAHTFADSEELAATLLEESSGRRDIAMYVADPHVVLSHAPQDLFLDPSDTYRLNLATWRPGFTPGTGFTIHRVQTRADARGLNELYLKRGMVSADPDFIWDSRTSRQLIHLVAEDDVTGEIIGTVTGINHLRVFNDPDAGSSLWCLAVDPATPRPGVGRALVNYLADYFKARGLAFMDLSVMHDNEEAKALYENLGFTQVRTFAVKRKNAINDALYIGPELEGDLNPYARIITDEARRRGIHVNVLDAREGYFELTHGGKQVTCRESLSDHTSAVAMSRVASKAVAHKTLVRAGLRVPDHRLAGDREADLAFLLEHGSVVVKPVDGEQGQGVSVDVRDPESLESAIDLARVHSDAVLVEQYCPGEDLRIVIIGYEVVAAAIRRPAEVIGNGRHSIRTLIQKQSRRRSAATDGESSIPLDDETERCVAQAGYALGDVLEEGKRLAVRKTANLHTGGTLHDVTGRLHPELRRAAVQAAHALDIPVVGLDMMVPSVESGEYVLIEANERPGLANHEPQPTAEKFLDFLFPLSRPRRAESE